MKENILPIIKYVTKGIPLKRVSQNKAFKMKIKHRIQNEISSII